MNLLVLTAFACGASQPVGQPVQAVAEVYDIPPPPAQRTVRLDGPTLPPGTRIEVRIEGGTRVETEVVLDTPNSVTVYVDERSTEQLLDAGVGHLTVVPLDPGERSSSDR